MSRITTLRDLEQRDGGGGGGFQGSGFMLGSGKQHKNSCMQCLDLFFPGFKLETVTFLFFVILVTVFVVTKVVFDTLIMGNTSGNPAVWICHLHFFGAKYTYDIVNNYQVWRLLTASLLHTSILHLVNNCLGILFFGFTVESQVKSWKEFVMILTLGAYEGNVLSAIFQPYQIGTGAGACIWAVVGVGAVWFKINYVKLGERQRQLFYILAIIIGCFALLDILTGKFDVWVHVGGLSVGLPLGVLVLQTSSQESFR